MLEPDVTLTDFALAIECGAFAFVLLKREGLARWFALFFGAIGLAALCGGLSHGFFPGNAIVWRATMVALGFASFSSWAIGARVAFSAGVVRTITRAALAVLAVYLVTVLSGKDNFLVAILHYLPGVLFFIVALTVLYARKRKREVLWGLSGLVLTLVASGLQQAGVGLHPVYFDHNALYHLIEAAALAFVFVYSRHTSPP